MLPLKLLLGGLIKEGTLKIIDHRGRAYAFGNGAEPSVTLRLHDRRLPWKMLRHPSLAVGEAYMDGRLTIEGGDILQFLNLVAANSGGATYDRMPTRFLRALLCRLRQANSERRARRNVARHYEFKTEFYDLFLDGNRQYSCGYFRSPNDSLDQAQCNKLDHIAGKLLLAPHHRVLDIGCGWGTLARHINAVSGAKVTGITLSEEQCNAANAMAQAEGRQGDIEFRLEDYRKIAGPFDRVVSVGMFEHVGLPNYDTYFRCINDLLTDDGIAMVHTIGRADGPGVTNEWTEKYIFPGGYSPALSEVMPAVERSGLFVSDVEVWRTHYGRTTEHWYRRFQQNRDRIRAMYDERFCRMFEFFLAGCVGSFDWGGLVVFQIQLGKKVDSVPLTRDYLYAQ
ncbi:MAG: methyltransferase domain-containing protein [Alphaproteobacteria bacterium]|nr:methyltransferase domain-containing protein [Alphaproteobacteria bacterium]